MKEKKQHGQSKAQIVCGETDTEIVHLYITGILNIKYIYVNVYARARIIKSEK